MFYYALWKKSNKNQINQLVFIAISKSCYILPNRSTSIHYRRKFRSQTSDNMDRWKAEMEGVREKRKSRRVEEQKKEDPGARKGRKVAIHCVFPMICGSGGSKSRLAKAAGAEPAGQMRDEKLHAVVARSTFRSQNVQNTPGPDHFWQLRCRKSARRCWREAHFEVKMHKTHHARTTFGSWDVEKCTPLWREAHFEVKMLKTPGFGPLLEVQMSFRVAGARDCAPCQQWAKREGFVAFSTTTTTTPHYTPTHYTTTTTTPSLHSTTLHSTTPHSTTLHSITFQLYSINFNYTTLHYITLHYTPLHHITLHYTTLRYLPLHYITPHYTPLHYNYNYTTTLHYTPLHPTTLNYTTLHYITLHYIPLHPTTLHYTTLFDYTTLHYIPLHYTTFHYTKLHDTNYNNNYNYN